MLRARDDSEDEKAHKDAMQCASRKKKARLLRDLGLHPPTRSTARASHHLDQDPPSLLTALHPRIDSLEKCAISSKSSSPRPRNMVWTTLLRARPFRCCFLRSRSECVVRTLRRSHSLCARAQRQRLVARSREGRKRARETHLTPFS